MCCQPDPGLFLQPYSSLFFKDRKYREKGSEIFLGHISLTPFFSPPPSSTVLEMKGVKSGSRIPQGQSEEGEQSKARESARNSARTRVPVWELMGLHKLFLFAFKKRAISEGLELHMAMCVIKLFGI